MPTPNGYIFDLVANPERDPYLKLALRIYDQAFQEVRSGNGKQKPAKDWLQSDAAYWLAALVFREGARLFRSWALAGCPDPERACQAGLKALIKREVSQMPLDYEQLGSSRVEVVDCKECGIQPRMRFLNSHRIFLECPRCKRKTTYKYFVMEAADEWEDINACE